MNGIGEIDHLSQKVGTGAEAFDDPGNLRATGTCAPIIVSGGGVAGGFGVFGDADLGFRVRVCVSHV